MLLLLTWQTGAPKPDCVAGWPYFPLLGLACTHARNGVKFFFLISNLKPAFLTSSSYLQNCRVDTHPEAAELKTHRVRTYQVVKILPNCPIDEVRMTNVLVIDNVTEADNGTYRCTGSMIIPTPWPVLRTSSMFVDINPGTYVELNT